MTFALTWLPDVLMQAGLKVSRVDGWEQRGRGEVDTTLGILCHHTAGSKNGNMPSLRTIIAGRPDLAGPLAQLGLGRDGTYYVIAAGRCNHAGAGVWNGVTNGNAHFIGIEAENTGLPNDSPWPAIQVEAYQRGVAAILKHLGLTSAACAGHKEYALPEGRKSDPDFDMVSFRSAVAAILAGTLLPPALIPAAEPAASPGAPAGRPTMRRGASGEFVRPLQAALGLPVDGQFGGQTEAAVRAFQRSHEMVPDGIVGPRTWLALDAHGVAPGIPPALVAAAAAAHP